MPRNETPTERSARRAAEKSKQKEIDKAAGITRQPPGRPPDGHQWDERLADWVPRPDPSAPELPLAAITAAMTSASVSGMSASPSAPASSPQLTQASFVPGGPRPTMLASSPLGSITISKEEVQHLIQRRQMQHHLIAIADAQPEADAAPAPAPEPAAADTSSPAASAAAAVSARDSLLAKLQHAYQHWEICVAFDRDTRPTKQAYDRVHSLRARAGRAPMYPPWNEWQRDWYRPPFPEINSGCCKMCVDAFLELRDRFEPCQSCLEHERVLCEIGGVYPSYTSGSRESVALPPYLLGRAGMSSGSDAGSEDSEDL